MHAEINARNAHGEREQQRRPADLFVAAEEHRKRGRHCRGHMARGEAFVTFGVLAEHFPILLENAAVVRIRAGPGDERFKADVCYQSADGKREQHRCAVPPRFAEKHQRDREQDEEDTALTEERNEREERGEEPPGGDVELMDRGCDRFVKAREGRIQPQRQSRELHKPDSFFF